MLNKISLNHYRGFHHRGFHHRDISSIMAQEEPVEQNEQSVTFKQRHSELLNTKE